MVVGEVGDVVQRVVELDPSEVSAAGDTMLRQRLQVERIAVVRLQSCDKLGEREDAVMVTVERMKQLVDELWRCDQVVATHGRNEIVQIEGVGAAPVELMEGRPQTCWIARVLCNLVLECALQLAHGHNLEPTELMGRCLRAEPCIFRAPKEFLVGRQLRGRRSSADAAR